MTSDWSVVLSMTGCSLMFLVGVPGNILIIWSYFAIKRIQTQQNIFIVSLAITDSVIIGYLLPCNMLHVLRGISVISRDMCILNAFVAHVCFTSGVQTIMHISVNRCVKICRSVQEYCRIYTRRNIILIIVSCWLMGPLFSIPLWIDMDQHFIYDDTLKMCIFNRYGDQSYTLIYQFLCLALPIIVTTISYVKIQMCVWNARRQISRHWNNGLAIQRFVQDLRSTKSHAIIFIAYLVLYLPFGIIATFTVSPNEVPVDLHKMSIYLCFANSCINCLIYGALNGNMRRAFKEALTCSICHSKKDILSTEELKTTTSSNNRIFPESNVHQSTAVHFLSSSSDVPPQQESSL